MQNNEGDYQPISSRQSEGAKAVRWLTLETLQSGGISIQSESSPRGGRAKVNSQGVKMSSHIPVVPTNNPFLPAPLVPSTSNPPPSAASNPFVYHALGGIAIRPSRGTRKGAQWYPVRPSARKANAASNASSYAKTKRMPTTPSLHGPASIHNPNKRSGKMVQYNVGEYNVGNNWWSLWFSWCRV
jgi:hypothetical protein